MTARELYDCDPGFRGFIAAWITDKRLPMPTADFLRDRDLEKQADAAFWASSQPDREQFWTSGVTPTGIKHGPFPKQTRDYYYWFTLGIRGDPYWANELPSGLSNIESTDLDDCLLLFLDNFVPPQESE